MSSQQEKTLCKTPNCGRYVARDPAGELGWCCFCHSAAPVPAPSIFQPIASSEQPPQLPKTHQPALVPQLGNRFMVDMFGGLSPQLQQLLTPHLQQPLQQVQQPPPQLQHPLLQQLQPLAQVQYPLLKQLQQIS